MYDISRITALLINPFVIVTTITVKISRVELYLGKKLTKYSGIHLMSYTLLGSFWVVCTACSTFQTKCSSVPYCNSNFVSLVSCRIIRSYCSLLSTFLIDQCADNRITCICDIAIADLITVIGLHVCADRHSTTSSTFVRNDCNKN